MAFRFVLLVTVASVLLIASAQQPELWVAGRVVRSDNGMPIEGATVELEQASALFSNGQNPTAITDKNGNYHFPEMTPATYRIRASADGYVWQTYSRDGTAEGQLQQLGETTHLHEIDFRLKREAVIRGILTGKKGESVGAGVFLAVVSEQEGEQGKVRLRLVNTVKTDASGRFVFTKLESGTYFVCVNGTHPHEVSGERPGSPLPARFGYSHGLATVEAGYRVRQDRKGWPTDVSLVEADNISWRDSYYGCCCTHCRGNVLLWR